MRSSVTYTAYNVLMAKMISDEQKELADFLKNVHLSLRSKSRVIGSDKAWEEHLQNEQVLRDYAFAMKKLAEEYWTVNNHSETKKYLCRIEWIINYILQYFQGGLLEKETEKEHKKLEMFLKKELIDASVLKLFSESNKGSSEKPPFKLLDVGSCYNPFGKFKFLEVYPIDLYPATSEVKRCNFLDTDILSAVEDNWFCDHPQELPANYFDIVVFSLFLEYLPSPKQRYVACVKAYECLKFNGLLLIVTPDSKHEGANARLMKSWKIDAAHIGFVRCVLEKLKYLYCMAFRKSASQSYPLLLNNLKAEEMNPEKMFIIPQDSVNYVSIGKVICEREEDTTREVFQQLPFA